MPTDNEPIAGVIDATAGRRATVRPRRYRFVGRYNGVENDTMGSTAGAWTAPRRLGFLLVAGGLAWGAIWGLAALFG